MWLIDSIARLIQQALTKFYAAEDHHQNFIDRNPTQGYIVKFDLPKLAQLRQQFPTLIKKS